MNLFLSHSSQNAEVAQKLKACIEQTSSGNFNVFLASRPDAIPINSEWFPTITEKLDNVDAIVVLYTKASERSV
jgi:hypothetical protein